MSNKKKKSNKKKMNPAVLAKLKLGFGTLFNNDYCIDAGRNWKGAVGTVLPITFAVISVVLAVVPGLATRLNSDYGAALMSSPTYSYDIGMTQFTDQVKAVGAHIEIVDGLEGPEIKETGWDNVANYTSSPSGTKWYQVTSEALDGEVVFEAFVNTFNIDDETFFSNILNNLDPKTGVSVDGRTRKAGELVSFHTNMIAFGKHSVIFTKYSNATPDAVASFKGSYARLVGTDIAKFAQVETITGYNRINATAEVWMTFVRDAMEDSKITGSWSYTGIIAAVYVGLVALFGFIIWLMCRGKNNPFRIYTVWECQKMAYWASIAPGILSLILGFMLTQYQLFFFIFLFGMRLMWMSMKSLRPVAPTK